MTNSAPASQTESKAASKPTKDRFGLTEEQFKHIAALFIAAAACFGTVVAALQVDAGARSATADRDSRAYTLQANADGNTATLRYVYESNMLASNQSLLILASLEMRLAQERTAPSAALDDRQAAARLGQIVNDQRALSDLLSSPYFDAKTGSADVYQYVVDHQTTPIALAVEKQAAKREQADAWSSKGNNYTITLTVLAAVVFLFGLAAILAGGIGYLFLAVGNLIAGGAFLAVAVTILLPVPNMPEEAMTQYARGFGDVYYAQTMEYFSAQQFATQRADQAIAEFTKAIALRRDYAAAYESRGDAHVLKGEALLFGKGDPVQVQSETDLAIKDFQRALELGRRDKHTYWDLGYSYFLAKQYPNAIAVSQQALELAPDQKLGLGINIALYMLAQGKRTEAMQQLEDSLAWAEKHRLASDSYYLRQAIHNVEQYMQVQSMDGLAQFQKRIKEAFVSLIYRDVATAKPTGAVLSALQFEQPILGVDGDLVERKPAARFSPGTERVDFGFDYNRMPNGALVVQKVYDSRQNEIALLGDVEVWRLGSAGHAERSIRAPVAHTLAGLASGRYTVELYVEGELLASGSFDID